MTTLLLVPLEGHDGGDQGDEERLRPIHLEVVAGMVRHPLLLAPASTNRLLPERERLRVVAEMEMH
jgi:hypothetical protein